MNGKTRCPTVFFECTLRPRRSDQWALFEDCVKNIKLPNVGAGTSAVNINTEYSLASERGYRLVFTFCHFDYDFPKRESPSGTIGVKFISDAEPA